MFDANKLDDNDVEYNPNKSLDVSMNTNIDINCATPNRKSRRREGRLINNIQRERERRTSK